MKINPKIKLNIVFWIITLPILPLVVLLLIIGLMLMPIPKIGNYATNKIEWLVIKFAHWRNNLPVVKNAYDKVHLFDYIKNSSGT